MHINRNQTSWRAHGYTLIEVLIVVVVLGIAAAVSAPAFKQTGVLQVQSALRTAVSDITELQSDALAMQQSRAIVFDIAKNSYTMCRVPGTSVDTTIDAIETRQIGGSLYGNAIIKNVNFNNSQTLIFDELGAPVASAGSNTPAADGSFEIIGSGQTYKITVQGYTGRVTVTKTAGD
ncbi:MAG: prepilin-type N-terminal cleavage/methylation domain-containing protein [Phycisphaeraceae bacterium]|nr:prepilin-type N-terminal cleavage/methylation domain-containing protein [Phycisphaeraceae bacterium]